MQYATFGIFYWEVETNWWILKKSFKSAESYNTTIEKV